MEPISPESLMRSHLSSCEMARPAGERAAAESIAHILPAIAGPPISLSPFEAGTERFRMGSGHGERVVTDERPHLVEQREPFVSVHPQDDGAHIGRHAENIAR